MYTLLLNCERPFAIFIPGSFLSKNKLKLFNNKFKHRFIEQFAPPVGDSIDTTLQQYKKETRAIPSPFSGKQNQKGVPTFALSAAGPAMAPQ